MNLLTPLGFIALIALIIFFIIYFIKPQYKSKVIESTFIWQESLKYKKNKNHTSKLRNIFLVILEILMILLTVFILVTPLVSTKDVSLSEQNVMILDASCNMQVETFNGKTRFSRAIDEIKDFSNKSIDKKKPVTIIYSGLETKYVVKQESNKDVIKRELDKLTCSNGTGNIKEAISLANDYIKTNANAEVYYYTATTYNNISDVKIVDMKQSEEWNAAILDVKADLVDNFYEFDIDLISYGLDTYLNVEVDILGANDEETEIKSKKRVNCLDGVLNRVSFKDLGIYAYDSIKATITMDDQSEDSLKLDNEYILHGGRKQVINIQYYSKAHNNFFDGMTRVLRKNYKDYWDIQVSEPSEFADIKYKGFDLYIFEHTAPTRLPEDGVILLVNPDIVPTGLDITLGSEVKGEFTMSGSANDDLIMYVDPSNIQATTYRPIVAGDKFKTLLNCNGEGVYVVNEEKKLAVLSLNLNTSNLAVTMDFPVLINNLFEHFIPTTITKNIYEVGEQIDINARGTSVELSSEYGVTALDIPGVIQINQNGEYVISQRLLNNKKSLDKFFVKVPNTESNINRVVKDSGSLMEIIRPSNANQDIYLYLAVALLILILIERLVYSSERI